MATRKEIEGIQAHRGAKDLALMAKKLGYSEAWSQLQFTNGASASDLFAFFDDNPGACEAVIQWVLEEGCHRDGGPLEEDEEEDDEEGDDDPEACPGCGCKPGDGVTEGCEHPLGCGENRKRS